MVDDKERLRVLVVDDSPLFREGLSNLLSNYPDIQVIGQAGDGLEAMTRARELMPDVVLMDIIMPHQDGIETTRLLRQEMPHLKIVMLTVSESEENLFNAIKIGAQGYLLKSVEARELVQVLRGLSQGETYVAPGIAAKILQEFTRPSYAMEELSPRETEVLRLVIQGMTNKEISVSLNIAESTVKNHLRNTMEKLHVRNRLEAAIRFLESERS